MDGISPSDVLESLSLDKNRKKVFKAGEGAGQSGSFFFFSHDNRFIIKTLRGSEKGILLNLLDDYIAHIKSTRNRSLLARIYGVFTFKTNAFDPMDIMIMQNTVQLRDKQNGQLKFDMKGSTKGRYVPIPKSEHKFWRTTFDQSRVMKDLNYEEINYDLDHAFIRLSEEQYEATNFICAMDSAFLEEHGLMDYSLLLIVEH